MNLVTGRTAAPAYVTNVAEVDASLGFDPEFTIIPLLTVGDEVPYLEEIDILGGSHDFEVSDTDTFAVVGIPDGIGLFQVDGYNIVFLNHELGSNDPFPAFTSPPGDPDISDISSTIDGQIIGGRVSVFVFDEEWNIIGGRNLIEEAIVVDPVTGIENTFTLDLTSGNYLDAAGEVLSVVVHENFSRFCSAFLADFGFVDPESGEEIPLYFNGEEVIDGLGWVHTIEGESYAIQGLGAYSYENVIAPTEFRPTNSEFTVLLSTDDFSAGPGDNEVYAFVGRVDATSDDFLLRNGLSSQPENFDLYVLRVVDPTTGEVFAGETIPEGQTFVSEWVLVPDEVALGIVAGSTLNAAEELTAFVNGTDADGDLVSTNFRRPEDIHEDPNNIGTFYFATTGDGPADPNATLPPGQGVGGDNRTGELHRFTFDLDENGVPVNGVFEAVLEGAPGNGASYDNIVVDSNNNVLLQEDVTADGDDVFIAEGRTEAQILSYNILTDDVTALFQLDQDAAGAVFNTGLGEWETSGIVEVDANALPGRSSYLFDVQAHSINTFDEGSEGALLAEQIFGGLSLIEGGQLILVVPTEVPTPVFGSPEADAIEIGFGTDGIVDLIFTGAAADFVDTSAVTTIGQGNNRVYLGSGADEAIAGRDDRLFGGAGMDILESSVGEGGNRLYGGAGDDEIITGSDNRAFGNGGNDILDATLSEGGSRLYGGDGNDTFFLGEGDRIIAGAGDDAIFVGTGGDNMITGGAGADTFSITTGEAPALANTITDFEAGVDFLGIGGGLAFADLTITAQDGNTAIAAGDQLAILLGVEAASITEANFTFA
ncbi:MAG: DUF839 domain-containing protein [Chloroflexaceae bacterium]|nr:DUF839 domain-containing protein [Chloroflexaceae bacterium]